METGTVHCDVVFLTSGSAVGAWEGRYEHGNGLRRSCWRLSHIEIKLILSASRLSLVLKISKEIGKDYREK
jgi:hypothetical protein